MQERRIDDCWNIDGSRDVSRYWTGSTQFTLLDEKLPDGFLWSREETDKTGNDIQARSFVARTLERNVKERYGEGEAKMGN